MSFRTSIFTVRAHLHSSNNTETAVSRAAPLRQQRRLLRACSWLAARPCRHVGASRAPACAALAVEEVGELFRAFSVESQESPYDSVHLQVLKRIK